MTTSDLTLLFADICNSTQLYESFGDQKARELISESLQNIRSISEHHGGIFVKTIGDELLIRFNVAGNAAKAAREIQNTSRSNHDVQLDQQKQLDVRVGLHYGPTIMESDDVFGDTVNIAARLVSLSKPRQILTSRETVELLPPDLLDKCRHIDRSSIKGKSERIDIYEILGEDDDYTEMTASATFRQKHHLTVIIRYRDQEYIFHERQSQFTIGRSEQCDLVVHEELASRQHLTLENRRDKFYILDYSTNGTWLRNDKANEIFLRRDEMLLPDTGSFSFGKSFNEQSADVLRFRIAKKLINELLIPLLIRYTYW